MKQKKKLMKATCFTGLWLLLLGCQSVPTKPTQVNDVLDKAIAQADKKVAPVALAEIPNAIQQELMQNDMLQAKKGLLAEKRLSIAASQIDADRKSVV